MMQPVHKNPTNNVHESTFNFKYWIVENKQIISIFSIFLILVIFFGISTSTFFSSNNFMNLIQQLSPNLIVVIAMTFVITTAGIDLSVGSIIAIASAVTATLLASGLGSVTTLIIVLLIGVLVGFINGFIISYLTIPPFIVTLSSMIFLRGVALLITGGYSIAIAANHGLINIGRGDIIGVPVPTILAVIVVLIGLFLIKKHKFGVYVTGIGANEEAVRRAGVNTKFIKMLTYILSGVCAALAGIIISTRLGSGSSNIGNMFEMDIIAAVVLGGTSLLGGKGTIVGSIIGVAIIGIINNGLTLMHVSPYIIQIIEGLVLLCAVLLNMRVFGYKKS